MKITMFLLFLIFTLIQDSYALETESDHFYYYYEAPDSNVISPIISVLEANYARITGDLQITISSKIIVRIYPTLQQFHSAIGQPLAPEWLVGVAFSNIFVVSPLNPGPAHSYNEIMNNVLVHEFTHACVNRVNRNIPIWLSEGFALYEGGPYFSKTAVVSAYNRLGKIPSLTDLEYNFDNFVKFEGYQFSLTIAYFIVKNYGMKAMREFIINPTNFSVFGDLTKNEFQNKWFEYVRVNYLGIDPENIPEFYDLEQNYPNPFNPETVISYKLPAASYVQLKIFNLLGQEITTLVDWEQPAGKYNIKFSSKENSLSNGIYLYRINAGEFVKTKKMLLLK